MYENDNRLHVSVHIEKTGGTTALRYYRSLYGDENILVYLTAFDALTGDKRHIAARTNTIPDTLRTLARSTPIFPLIISFILRNFHNRVLDKDEFIQAEQIPSNIRVVHGHFLAYRFDGIVENPLRSVVLRDPFDRMWSHYCHWRKAHGNVSFRTKIPYDPLINFSEFSLSQPMENYQTQALAGIDLRSFNLVGTTERLPDFFNQLSYIVDNEQKISGNDIPHLNRRLKSATDYEKTAYLNNSAFMCVFRQRHQEDYTQYRIAQELVKNYSRSKYSRRNLYG